jgi:hypothetical protein
MLSSINRTYRTAVNLNNQGVSLLSKGNFDAACNSFKNALDAIKSVVTVVSTTNVDHQQEVELNVGFEWSTNAPLHFSDVMSFVYRRAMIIVSSSGYSERGYPEESTAIIYNLALSFHLSALERNCSSLMNKALKFYQIAEAIRNCSIVSKKLEEGDRLVDAVILNNMGQICMECFDFGNAQRCFSQLSAKLVALSQRRSLEHNDCEGFMLNLLLKEPSLAAAA